MDVVVCSRNNGFNKLKEKKSGIYEKFNFLVDILLHFISFNFIRKKNESNSD